MSTRFQDGEILCAAPLNEFDDLLVALCNAATTAEVRTCLGMLTETELGEQYLRLDGTNRMTDQLQLEGTDPVEDWHAVTKKWVADQLALIGASQGYARHDETLVAHGFTVGQAIYWDGGQWQLAQADALSTTGTHVVAFVYDVDTFQVAQSGYLDGLAGLQGGEVYYVSDATPGALTTTAPAIENPLLLAIDETTGWVLNHKAEQQSSSPIIDHPDTTNRDAADSHPISAITGLQAALDTPPVHNDTTSRDAADAHPISAVTDLTTELATARAGRKNVLINGDFRVNQRAGTRTPGIGFYGFDRWKGHTNGLEQVVEQLSLRDGTYTLSWVGGGSGTLDGGALAASPITAAITADHDVSVTVPSDATDVQLEPGSQATAFELRSIGEELALCQRYYWEGTATGKGFSYFNTGTTMATPSFAANAAFPVTMRAIPTLSLSGGSYSKCVHYALTESTGGLEHQVTPDTPNNYYRAPNWIYTADAEL